MKKFEELTPEDCQSFLDELDTDAEFKQLFNQPEDMGIEYSIKSKDYESDHNYVSVSNPELLSWMYKNEVDLTIPLEQLKYDYTEMDETNSVLFEYAMEINKIIKEDYKGDDKDHKFYKIEKVQKELVNKL